MSLTAYGGPAVGALPARRQREIESVFNGLATRTRYKMMEIQAQQLVGEVAVGTVVDLVKYAQTRAADGDAYLIGRVEQVLNRTFQNIDEIQKGH